MIKLPTNMKNKIKDFDLVESRLFDYWNENRDVIQGYLKGRLLGVKAEYDSHNDTFKFTNETFDKYIGDLDNPNTTSKFKSTLRLTLGYGGLTPTLTHKMIGLYSEKALDLKLNKKMGKKCVDDHLFGVTEVGNAMFMEYKNSGWDLNYVLNEWLPQHLYLWLQVKILKTEHQGDGSVKRGKHTLEEKISLVHYDEANISQIKVLS